MKTNQKLPMANCRMPIEFGNARLRSAQLGALAVAQAFQPAGTGNFPVAGAAGQDCPGNPQTGKSALLRPIENRKSTIENGFTLIELLTVIAVIAIIAAMIFPVARTVKRQTIVHSAQAQMAQLQTALERYKSVYGFYPPASAWALTNQLYFELEGTFLTNSGGAPVYMTLDHLASISASPVTLSSIFGPGVGGFMNCNKPGADESAARAQDFLLELNTNQFSAVPVAGTPVNLLVSPVGGPDTTYTPLGLIDVNPWRYIYPGTNNPGSYDLWIQLVIAGKTNLVCNWDKQVQINNPLR